jgi:hypothetical protein
MSKEKIKKEKKEESVSSANNGLMKANHTSDKTIFYKYSGYLKDLLGEEKENGSMGK